MRRTGGEDRQEWGQTIIFKLMKKSPAYIFVLLFIVHGMTPVPAQTGEIPEGAEQAIHILIDQYSLARETRDEALLESILTADVDQLVSSGNWRKGREASLENMMRSSNSNPGKRTLEVESIRFLNPGSAIADARYDVHFDDGSARKMWSSFVVVEENGSWKITAIRNMLPAQ